MSKVVYLGNHSVPFSTESHLCWTWEHKLGWQVVRLQEGRVTSEQILEACKDATLFQWSHTHGWPIPGNLSMDEMLIRIREKGVKSLCYHLDIYFGLNILDKREERIGKTADWKVDYFFSTDGGHQAEYESRGVHHYYLPAGVVEYGCYLGRPCNNYAAPVGFVGSVGYHPEYAFRRSLVEGLGKRYGTSFRVFNGLREGPLNDAYASMKVVVGDHCFSGIPYYASDRLWETVGRGGFIIYPETRGVTDLIPGLVTFQPQNLDDLYSKIDYFLDPAHDAERVERRNAAHEYVKQYGTYSQRLQEVLRTMGCE